MKSKKHKRKMNHVIILTSDAVDTNVRQFRIKPWLVHFFVVVICILIGGVIGYIFYEEQIRDYTNQRIEDGQQSVAEVETEKQRLEEEIAGLTAEITLQEERNQLLSETVNQYVQTVEALQERIDRLQMPSRLPLTGSVSIEEVTDENPMYPMCNFTASAGAVVVAAASGTVETIVEDPEYGNVLTLDHGNGYKTIYRNQGSALVKVGDSVNQGGALFIVTESNTKLGYQMMLDGVLINPMSMLEISG